jgi:prepilin-type N-terminal cleavage/methylation domain-containing protein
MKHKNRPGFSMVEVMISILLISMVAIVTLRTFVMSDQMAQIESMRSTALYACQDVIEQMLSDQYENITPDYYPDQYNLLLETRGTADPEDDVYCNRTVEIYDVPLAKKQRKEVRVTVTYEFTGQQYSEEIFTVIVAAGR